MVSCGSVGGSAEGAFVVLTSLLALHAAWHLLYDRVNAAATALLQCALHGTGRRQDCGPCWRQETPLCICCSCKMVQHVTICYI